MAIRRWLMIACGAIALGSALGLALEARDWLDTRAYNEAVRSSRYADAAMHGGEHGLFAGAFAAHTDGRYQDARVIYSQLEKSADSKLRSASLFNAGNTYLQQAAEIDLQADSDRALPLIELAKASYREALHVDPDLWPARYNLERALQLLPDAQEKALMEVEGRRGAVRTIISRDPDDNLP